MRHDRQNEAMVCFRGKVTKQEKIMESYFVYKHTAPNGKVYIGITRQNPEKRWSKGLGYNRYGIFHNAIKKYGWENIKHEILFFGLTKEEAKKKEIELIAQYKSTEREYGYNMSPGGDIPSQTPEANKKRSQTMKTKWKETVYKENATAHMRGAKRSEQACENIRAAQKKRFENEEERKKISIIQTGKKRSDEAKRKTSESLKIFYSNPENAKRIADHQREPNRRTHGRKVRCVETGKIYEVITDAAKEYGIDRRGISAVCRHKRKKVAGYTWEYV